jgi:hypothetical protein
MRAAFLVGLSLVAASAVSAAPAEAQPAPVFYHRKSHDIAKGLSGVGAGVSTALVFTSFLLTDPHNPYNVPLFYSGVATSIVTPSLGEYYAEQYLTWGEALRAGAAGLAILGVNLTTPTSCLTTADDNSCSRISTAGIAILGAGLIIYIGGMFYDVLDAPDAVDRYNYNARMHVMLAPGLMPSSTGAPPGGGLWLSGTF